MVKEIDTDDFTAENFERLAKTADAKCKPPRRFNGAHFFPEVQMLMHLDLAKVWSNEKQDALLVGLFHKNIFSGDPIGLILFWVSSGVNNQAGLELLGKFQSEAAQRGCVATYASAFRKYRSAGMARLFRRLGYEPHELGFVKMLQEDK